MILAEYLVVSTTGGDFVGSVSARRELGKIVAVTASIAVAS